MNAAAGIRARPSHAHLREVLAPPFREYSAEELDAFFADAGLDAQELEEFLGALTSLGGQIARGAQSFLPQVQQFVQTPQFQAGLQGALQGGQMGMAAGPYGAAIGAGVGLLSSLFGGQRPAPAPPAGMPTMPLPAPAPPMQMPPPGGFGVTAQPARGAPAAQLLGLLSHPQVLQALMAMLLGPAGARTVPVGGAQVPVGQIPAALGLIANQAQAEHAAALAAAGEVAAPEADPFEAAARVAQLLANDTAQATLAARRQARAARLRETVEEPIGLAAPVEYDPVY